MDGQTFGEPLTVFISARVQEMAAERLAAGALVAGMHLRPVLFEHLRPMRSPRPVFLEAARTCDIFVGVYGNEYGDPVGGLPSPIEQEFLETLESPLMPRLLFVRRSRGRQRKLHAFLQRAADQSIVFPYSGHEDLAAKLKIALNGVLATGFRELAALSAIVGPVAATPAPPPQDTVALPAEVTR